jgi:hypothetical protein
MGMQLSEAGPAVNRSLLGNNLIFCWIALPLSEIFRGLSDHPVAIAQTCEESFLINASGAEEPLSNA